MDSVLLRSHMRRGGAAVVPAQGSGVASLRLLHAANVVVFLLWRIPSLHNWMLRHFTLTQTSATDQRRWWTLFTPCLSHADPAHLAGNLAFLEAFGRPLALLLGPARFTAFYAAAGAAAHLAWMATVGALRMPRPRLEAGRRPNGEWVCPDCTLLNRARAPTCAACGRARAGGGGPETHCLGASGSVSGVITAAGLLFPLLSVSLHADGTPQLSIGGGGTPLAAFGLAYLLRELFIDRGQALGLAPEDGVGHAAHWGGAAFGVLAGVAARVALGLPLQPRLMLRLLLRHLDEEAYRARRLRDW
eukprot:TRINITY_DN16307_c0_g1_i1.p1 TRINITY_DN16307_c0_g1~~TRINITY_DN16307_c0_g1_i1.p1  ORF type:complete len:303 (+),score=59.83 TRINITY_DN16307_c0_g1_i1:69-977(+)